MPNDKDSMTDSCCADKHVHSAIQKHCDSLSATKVKEKYKTLETFVQRNPYLCEDSS